MDHPSMVAQLAKPGDAILTSLDPDKCHMIHMVMGISTEAGELEDAVKKMAIYGKPLDIDNCVEELGDLEFYLEGFRQKLGVTREQVIAHNIAKLGNRYKDHQYSDQQAQERNDKKPPAITQSYMNG